MASRPYLWRDGPEGRVVSPRLWVLIWVAPVVFALAAIWLTFTTLADYATSVPVEAQVVQVYSWPGESIFDKGVMNYAPVYRYVDPVEQVPYRATAGLAHPGWNFEVGSQHVIRVFPGQSRDVMRPGLHNWVVALAVGAMAAVLALPAFWGSLRVLRWLKG